MVNSSKCQNKDKTQRSRGWMYVQQLDKLYFNNIEALERRIKSIVGIKRWALIIHDHDVNERNEPIAAHVHVMLEFKNPKSITSLSNQINDKKQYFENMTKQGKHGIDNGFCYLIHVTKNAQDKYQYDPSSVIANFNYLDFISSKVKEAQQKRYCGQGIVKHVINDYINGRITRTEAILLAKKYNPLLIPTIGKKMDDIDAELQRVNLEIWCRQKKKEHKPKEILWLYGTAGAGKTWSAEILAKYAYKKDSFKMGSTRDPFQEYAGQHLIILDDFRPDTIKYEDLLRLIDPYNYEVQLPTRYHDSPLLADTIIITTPYSPPEFYREQRGINRRIDKFSQLARRLSYVVQMAANQITLQVLKSDSSFKEEQGYLKFIDAQYRDIAYMKNMIAVIGESDEDKQAFSGALMALLKSDQNKLINEVKEG